MAKWQRVLGLMGLGASASAAASLGGASWYYSSRITQPPAQLPALAPEDRDRVSVVAVSDTTITLRGPDAARPGIWGVTLLRGYARVGQPIEVTDVARESREGRDPVIDQVAVRPILLRHATLDDGAPGILDGYAAPADPSALGLPWSDVTYDSPLGAMPAWQFDAGDGQTWAIFVHGRAARRQEAFRILPVFTTAGITCLPIAYRDDAEGPSSPDGHTHLGATEWEDVEAAVQFALDRGAKRVILVGFSMGGACVSTFLRQSALADRIVALVLEAPVLDWGAVIRQAAISRGMPRAMLPMLLPTSMRMARMRAGIDFRSLRQLDDTAIFTVPTFLAHGEADNVVPVELSDALVEQVPGIDYLRVAQADHVRCWNLDPERYQTRLAAFLSRLD
jgi:alpha-beta hydrolase superfamily lysophospholipase